MLLSVFTGLYELIIGINGDFPEYRENIFPLTGLITFILSLVICLFFYVVLGRWKNIWHKLIHWVITIVLVAIIGFGFAYSQATGILQISPDSYLFGFAAINALYSALYFIAASFIFKNFSIFSKRTPF